MTMGPPTVAALVTVIFSITGTLYLGRTIVAFSWPDRISNLAHVPMSIVMISMPWWWNSVFPTVLQIVVFSLCSLWYLFLVLFGSTAPTDAHGHHTDPAVVRYHAVMMAAMVWMAVAMSPTRPGVDDMAGMPGMPVMPGMTMAHSMSPGELTMTGSAPWAIVVSTVLGVAFVAAAAWFVARLLRLARSEHPGAVRVFDGSASLLMAAGMATAFLTLMT